LIFTNACRQKIPDFMIRRFLEAEILIRLSTICIKSVLWAHKLAQMMLHHQYCTDNTHRMEEAIMYDHYDKTELALLENTVQDEAEFPWFLDQWELGDFEDILSGTLSDLLP
jgi:hypothetical protein